jgi:biopolymer transport protein ExbD
MKFRKKHKGESGEVFTDSLNDILFILLMFFLIVATLANPNVIKVGLGKAKKDTKAHQDIMVSIDKEQQFFIGSTKVNVADIDTLLSREIRKFKVIRDTPVVVMNADTSTYFGNVFKIRRIAKENAARLVERVDAH